MRITEVMKLLNTSDLFSGAQKDDELFGIYQAYRPSCVPLEIENMLYFHRRGRWVRKTPMIHVRHRCSDNSKNNRLINDEFFQLNIIRSIQKSKSFRNIVKLTNRHIIRQFKREDVI